VVGKEKKRIRIILNMSKKQEKNKRWNDEEQERRGG
jgi:hypothetical protein